MIVELYEQVPESGTVPERWFDAAGSCAWVRFVDDDGDEWAGVFGRSGFSGHCKAVLCGDGRTALVIADGQGYVVDAQTGELHHKTTCDCLCDAIAVPGREFVIACDFTGLYAVSKQGEVWHSPRVALDGIRLNGATEASVTGEAWWHDEWCSFTLEFDGWRIQGDLPA